jgi:hypothetical protein
MAGGVTEIYRRAYRWSDSADLNTSRNGVRPRSAQAVPGMNVSETPFMQ